MDYDKRRHTPIERIHPAFEGWRDAERRLEQHLARISEHDIVNAAFVREPEGYEHAFLSHGEGVEIVALRWPAGTFAGLHGHGPSSALMRVVSGTLREDHFVPSGRGYVYGRVLLARGETSFLPPRSFHRVEAVSDAIGVHAYGPPLADPTAPVPPEVRPLLEEACRVALGGRVPPFMKGGGS